MEVEVLDYDNRMRIIRGTFCKKMKQIYMPHKHLVENDAVDVYVEEVAELINQRLPTGIKSQDAMVGILRKVWEGTTAKHGTRFFFSLADVGKVTAKVGYDYRITHLDPPAQKTGLNQVGTDLPVKDKSRPSTMGWTVEKARKHIQETQELIDAGGFPMGHTLIKIPQRALALLLAEEKENNPF